MNNKTEVKNKRRVEFRKKALRALRSYTHNSLSARNKNETQKSRYKEWISDYHAMISQGEKAKSLSDNEFRVFVQAVYGWMPVLYSQQDIRGLRNNLQKILSGEKPSKKIITESASCFSSSKHSAGSISALSKLLHFCNPESYPVWDTRVAKVLGRKSGTGNNADIYLDYLAVMSELKSDERLNGYCALYKKLVDDKATKIRALEHGLFLRGSSASGN